MATRDSCQGTCRRRDNGLPRLVHRRLPPLRLTLEDGPLRATTARKTTWTTLRRSQDATFIATSEAQFSLSPVDRILMSLAHPPRARRDWEPLGRTASCRSGLAAQSGKIEGGAIVRACRGAIQPSIRSILLSRKTAEFGPSGGQRQPSDITGRPISRHRDGRRGHERNHR